MRGIEMKATSFIKKSIILGLSVSLLSLSVFAQADDDEVVELLDENEGIMLIDETESTTGTLHVKQNKSGATVTLSYKGKKKFNVVIADNASITMDELTALDGKVVKLTGTTAKKLFKVTSIHNITDSVFADDSK